MAAFILFLPGLSIDCQVWEDGSTFRGELKAKAREIVAQTFDLFPREQLGVAEHHEYVAKKVAEYLEKGLYLRGGVDAQASRPTKQCTC